MTDVCYSACNPFTMASEGLYTSQTRHMTIFIQNCDGHTGPRPTEPQRSRAVPHGCPAILHVSTSAPPPQDRHKTAPHHIAHCYIHLRITVDAQGSSCGSKRGKKKPRVFSRLKCHECHRLPDGSLCDAFKTARMGTCVHAHPSISVYPSARPSAFSVRPFVPSVRPSVRAHLVAWPGLFTATTVALRGSWR